jgi:hypothetical protein
MEDEQATYLLMVRAEPGVDSIRALRAWLKNRFTGVRFKVRGNNPERKGGCYGYA